ncbi:MAG TPA: 5'-nucleotidase C-terminal domain-containing protein [Kofleriaceae bacterium]|jgi:5'-nucleotidase
MKAALAVSVLAACSASAPPPPPAAPQPPAHVSKTITIIGTSDLHGALERLPIFGGFVANVRAARAADGGVVLVDGGDLFQGTLESNLAEGADVIRAYNALGYTASAVGNHEFDYGPIGPDVTAKPGEDRRGALKARASEAKFPFVTTNIIDTQTGKRIDWPNMPASTLVDVAGVPVGIVGASTEGTPFTTMPANFVGLAMAPSTTDAIAAEAQSLRARGAKLVILAAHIGSECKDNTEPTDLSTCDKRDELFRVLDAMPKGLIDVAVAGHTHQAIAKTIDGVAVIESMSSGRAFGRVDVHLTDGAIDKVTIHPPELMCPLDAEHNAVPVAECHPGPYEGRPIEPVAALQKIADEAIARAGARRAEPLGVTLATPMTKAYKTESAEGDWLTELMLAAEPRAQVALTNGGGLRADIAAGPLTYGELFSAMPFDNRFALVTLRGSQLRELVVHNLEGDGGIFSWAGLTARARCKADKLDVAIEVGGKPLVDALPYVVATSDFLASGGDGVIGKLRLPSTAIELTDLIVRDAMADVLRAHPGTLDPKTKYAAKRLDYVGARPLRCGT